MILAQCGHCGNQLRFSRAHLGKQIQCPNCSGVVELAEQQEEGVSPGTSVPPRESSDENQVDVHAADTDVSGLNLHDLEPTAAGEGPSASSEPSLSQSAGPEQANPVPAVPVQATPVQAIPVPAVPVQAVPVQATPVPAAPVQAVPVPAVPVQAVPVQAIPVPAAPVQAAPVPAIPVQAVPVQAVPVQAMPMQSPFETPAPVPSGEQTAPVLPGSSDASVESDASDAVVAEAQMPGSDLTTANRTMEGAPSTPQPSIEGDGVAEGGSASESIPMALPENSPIGSYGKSAPRTSFQTRSTSGQKLKQKDFSSKPTQSQLSPAIRYGLIYGGAATFLLVLVLSSLYLIQKRDGGGPTNAFRQFQTALIEDDFATIYDLSDDDTRHTYDLASERRSAGLATDSSLEGKDFYAEISRLSVQKISQDEKERLAEQKELLKEATVASQRINGDRATMTLQFPDEQRETIELVRVDRQWRLGISTFSRLYMDW